MLVFAETQLSRFPGEIRHTGSNPPGLIPSGLFKQPKSLERDLRLIEDDFNNRGINHRIFSTTVSLREAGWIRRDARDDV